MAAVEKVRERNPEVYLKIIGATLLAKLEASLDVHHHHDLLEAYERASHFADAWKIVERAKAMIGSKPILEVESERLDVEFSDADD